MKIVYKNITGDEINISQAKNIDFYLKLYFDAEIPIKKELYENQELKNTSFYVSTLDQIDIMLKDIPNLSFELSYNQGAYKVVEFLSYKNKILVDKVLTVENSNEDIICYQVYDLITGKIIPTRTEKTYYDEQGEEKYLFDYNEDGTCFKINDLQEPDGDILASRVDEPENDFFSWSDYSFYQFAEPAIPN